MTLVELWKSDLGKLKYAQGKGGVKIAYWVYGEGDETVVFVMGLGMDHRGWTAQIPFFSSRFKVIAIDNRGVGKSDVPEPPYSTEDMAEDVLAVLENENVDFAHLVGASMGGMILQKFASRYPERVGKLVLACTLAKMTEHEKKLVSRGVEFLKGMSISADEFGKFAMQMLDINPKMLFDFMSKYLFSPEFLSENESEIKEIFRLYLSDGFHIKGFLGQLMAVLGHDGTEDLEKIKSPTLVITGDADRMVPREKSEFIASRIENSKLVVIPGGSHAFMMEKADEFNREVETFLLD